MLLILQSRLRSKILKMQKMTTPLGLGATFDKSGAAHSTINGAEVIVKPDEVSNSSEKFALTSIEGTYGKIDNIMASDDKIVSFDGPGQPSFTIKTTYPSESYPSGQSGYGRAPPLKISLQVRPPSNFMRAVTAWIIWNFLRTMHRRSSKAL